VLLDNNQITAHSVLLQFFSQLNIVDLIATPKKKREGRIGYVHEKKTENINILDRNEIITPIHCAIESMILQVR